MRPQRQQPLRFPHPWDSPAKNTGVGCHFLLQCMKMKSESEVTQSCPTQATPWTAAYQAPPSMGFSRQKNRSGVPLPSPVQLLSRVQLFVTPWTAVCQASLSITDSQSLLKLMPIESVMPYNHLILCCPLLLTLSIFPSIRVFSNESVCCIMWLKYWSFSFNISPSNEYSGLISLQSKGLSSVFSNTTVQKPQFFSAQLSLWANSHIHT